MNIFLPRRSFVPAILALPKLPSSLLNQHNITAWVKEREEQGQTGAGSSKLFMWSALACTAVSDVGCASHLYPHCVEKIRSI